MSEYLYVEKLFLDQFAQFASLGWTVIDQGRGCNPALLPAGSESEVHAHLSASHASKPDLTSRAVLDKLASIQKLDVHFRTTDGRTSMLSRYTEPNPDQRLSLDPLRQSVT